MDHTPLFREQIDAGARLIVEVEKFTPIRVAYWLKDAETGRWTLSIAPDRLNDDNYKAMLGQVLDVAQRLRDPNFGPFDLRLVMPGEPAAREALEMQRRFPGSIPTRFGRKVLGHFEYAGGFIYPLTAAASESVPPPPTNPLDRPDAKPLDPSAVQAGYDRWAAVYDHDANPLPALEEPFVRARAGDVRGLAVLDLGCGTGRHTQWLAREGAIVTALDFSEAMLAEARRKPGLEAVRFVAHDLRAPLPFPDGAFDLVVSGLVLEHVRDLEAVLREIRRVLKSDGRAIVSELHPAMTLRGSRARFADPETGAWVYPGSEPHTMGAFVMAAVRAGFRPEHIGEHAPDAAFAARFPRAEKHVGWPMLVVFGLAAG